MDDPDSIRGVIFNIKGFALHDGPGIRTTVFLKGCPLRCWWCHNPEGQRPQPEPMLPPQGAARGRRPEQGAIGRRMSVAEVLAVVEKDVIFYDESGGGVTFSGGEPLAQIAFLDALLDACGSAEIHTVLDTTGYAPAGDLLRIADKVRLFLFDLKLIEEGQHIAYTGVSNRPILDNLALLARRGRPLRIRFPLVPGITDRPDNLDRLAALVGELAAVEGIDVLPFHRIGGDKWRRLGGEHRLQRLAPPSSGQIDAAVARLAACGKPIAVGG
jgi:pyruvate formate lyase activating enzyme